MDEQSDSEHQYNILIAEDDMNQRLSLFDMLETNDFNVFDAKDGKNAIELLQTSENIDLVLLDYNMPEMDGLDVLVWMKGKEKYRDIPVVMMSTEEEVKRLSYCIDKGAKDYMIKPIRFHNIKGLNKYICNNNTKHKSADSVAYYEKIKTLGRGASGIVDLVKNKKDYKLYAMKMMPMFHFDDFKKKAAQNEITLLRLLDSPFIVKYYEHFIKNGNMYIIMEFCEGGTIDELIAKYKIEGNRFSNEQVKNWIAELVLAIMLIHSKNILHRDLKLQNMFLSQDNTIKQGDFGVSKELEENVDFTSTICGTPYYMSPELAGGVQYSAKADIFGLGCALYELLTFELPFSDENMLGLFNKILKDRPPPIDGDYDEECKEIVFSMLEKDPDMRPSIYDLYQREFIKTRIFKWSFENPEIKTYVESIVSLNKNHTKKNQKAKASSSLGADNQKDDVNKYLETPHLLITNILPNLIPTLVDYKQGYFSESEKGFKGRDLISCVKKIKAFEKVNDGDEIFEQLGKFLIERGILIRLDNEDTWDIEKGYYNLTFQKPVFPHNIVFTIVNESVKDPYDLSCKLITTLGKVYDEVIKNYRSSEPHKIYECCDFLDFLRDISMLQVCDMQSMSNGHKKAFFFNILQCIFYHEYFITCGREIKSGIMQSYGLKKDTKRVTYKIGKFEFNYEDIIHGLLRENKAKPGAWFAPFSNNDPRIHILYWLKDNRILAWMQDEIYKDRETVLQRPEKVPDDEEMFKEHMGAKFSNWVKDNIAYDQFSNEIIIPTYVKNYLVDFDSQEINLQKQILQYLKSKYMKNDLILSQYNDGNLFLAYDDNKNDSEVKNY